VLTIVKSENLCIDEVRLFLDLQKWAKAQVGEKPEEVKALLKEILPHIRFPLMTVAELSDNVSPSGLLTDEQMLALFQYAAIKSEKERARVRPPFNAAQRAAGITKDSKLLLRRFKKDLYEMFGKDVTNIKLELLYRGSRDGFTAAAFHSKSDGKGPTLSVIKPQNQDNIFGAYHASSWASGNSFSTGETWIFSLINQSGKPIKLVSQNTSYNAHFNSAFGPTYGGSGSGTYDIHISDTMKSTLNTAQPVSFRLAPGYTGAYTKSLLAGSQKFVVEEIEVFAVKDIQKGGGQKK